MIDLMCYRRHGHNEGDDPAFTQPVMYREIEAHPRVREIYSQRLMKEGKLSGVECEGMKASVRDRLEKAQAEAKEKRPRQTFRAFGGVWQGYSRARGGRSAETAL